MDTVQDINFSIYRAFVNAGIEFAFATQTLHVVKDTSAPVNPTLPTND